MNNVIFKKAVQNYNFFFNRPNFFLNFVPKISKSNQLMKLKNLFGLPLVYVGVAILAASYFIPLGNSNALLFCGLLCIVAGSIVHVWKDKKG